MISSNFDWKIERMYNECVCNCFVHHYSHQQHATSNESGRGLHISITVKYTVSRWTINSHHEEHYACLVIAFDGQDAKKDQYGAVQSCEYNAIPIVKDFAST
jgi:hypothetical protein